MSKETMTKHRNPMLDPERTGIGIHTIGIDWMHTISLGVSQIVLGHLVWAFITANVFRIPGTAPNVLELTVVRIREALFAFYKAEQREGRNHTRVQQLSPTMFAERNDPACRLHGSETNGFLFFAKAFLAERGECLGAAAKHYTDAVSALCTIVGLITANPRVLSKQDQQTFAGCVAKHMRALRCLGIHTKPKHHFLIEMAGKPLCRNNISDVVLCLCRATRCLCGSRPVCSSPSLELSCSAHDAFRACGRKPACPKKTLS
jgi:hypothetical protein